MIQEILAARPLIPEGPMWGLVSIAALGVLKSVVLEALKKRNGHRLGTRNTDDIKLDRAQIEREFELSVTVLDIHDMLGRLTKLEEAQAANFEAHRLAQEKTLDRLLIILEAVQRTNEMHSNFLNLLSANSEHIKEHVNQLATSAELAKEAKEIRHDWRNALDALKGQKL